MKKLLLFFACIFLYSSNISAQTWSQEGNGSYGLANFEARTICVFKGNIFVGGGFYNPDEARILVSPNGNLSSFNEDFNFSFIRTGTNSLLVSDMQVTPNGNLMFVSTETMNDDPHLFSYNGSTWADFGNIPWVVGDSSWYNKITAVGFYSSNGNADSVYVAVEPSGNGYANNIGTQIYRSSVNNPSWQFVDSIGLYDGRITDFEVFNNKMYFSTDYYPRVFEAPTGVNFQASSDTAFVDDPTIQLITDLQVYNGELYASTSTNDTCTIWKSADGVNWNTAGIKGLGGTDVEHANSMFVHNGLLYISGNLVNMMAMRQASGTTQSLPSHPSFAVLYSWDGSNYTSTLLDASSDYSDQASNTAIYFKNSFYCLSSNGSYGTILYKGCLPYPGPMTLGIPSDTSCQYSTQKVSTNHSSMARIDWYQNHVFSYSADTFYMSNSYAGTYETVKAIATNGACTDTVIDSVYILPQFTLDSLSPSGFQTVCEGTYATFTAYTTSGTPPYSYSWNYLGNNVGNTASVNVQAIGGGTVSVNVYDYYGCSAYGNANLFSIPSTAISGTATWTGGTVDSATVYLIQQGASSSQYDIVDTAYIITSNPGMFYFSSAYAGNYYIRVEADTTMYPTLINTYYGDHYLWDSASIAVHGCANTDTNDVFMIDVPPTSGTGTISGYVYEGVGFGQKLAQGPGNPTPFANVIPGVPIKVGKNPGGTLVASGTTGDGTNGTISGQYVFNNLPYDSYKIYTDIPGYPMDSSYSVTLGAGADSLIDLDYFVDSNSVYVDLTTGSHIANVGIKTISTSVHPNPSTGIVTVRQFFPTEGNIQILVSDMNGKNIFSKSIGNNGQSQFNYQLDLSSVEKGIYMLRVIQNGRTTVSKITIY